ncbi:phage holin family protein [Nocardioides marinquilinus]|uniref:Phage holin family protein n=1 Tax=Nocardioides marinquilinus TaxID=1210400 RepID=A0ABP9PNF4_9ACTN
MTGQGGKGGQGSLRRRLTLARRDLARTRLTWTWLRAVVRSLVVSFVALTVTLALVPGRQVPEGDVTSVVLLVLAVLLVGALLRPLLTRITVITGVFGLLLTGFLAQSVVLGVALALVPSIEPIDFPEIVLAAWLVAIVAAVLNWVVDASSEEVFLAQVLGRSVRTARRTEVSGPGLLVVQLDGVSEPLLRQAAAAGSMPYLTGLLRSGDYRLRTWHTGIPSTTPAGQAVLLHGEEAAVPGFRWYDKAAGRVVRASRPDDAAEVEAAFTDGRGLLAGGGTSVATIFSGDAGLRALTMSHARLPGSERGAAEYAASRSGFVRSIVLFVGEILTEWYQARRQRHRDVVPRVDRGGTFRLLRGLTTVVLKDLSVAIVADQLARGVPVVWVDFLDYDEVAHHAGPTRAESMHTLESLDRALRFLAELAEEVGRDYEIAVVSDHGQTQGATFRQLTGRSLAQAVRELVEPGEGGTGSVADDDEHRAPAETLAPANLLRAGGARGHGLVERSAATREPARPADVPQVQVLASGGLAHLYVCDRPGRLTRAEVEAALPALLPGLCALEHVGVVVTRRDDGALVVENGRGRRAVAPDGSVAPASAADGDDPLAVYGPGAAADLAALERKQHVGDVVLLARYDPRLDEVAAFEELVGSHGGIGGPQTLALFAHPEHWDVPEGRLGGTDVHRVLVERLVTLGLRDDEPVATEPAEVGR